MVWKFDESPFRMSEPCEKRDEVPVNWYRIWSINNITYVHQQHLYRLSDLVHQQHLDCLI